MEVCARKVSHDSGQYGVFWALQKPKKGRGRTPDASVPAVEMCSLMSLAGLRAQVEASDEAHREELDEEPATYMRISARLTL